MADEAQPGEGTEKKKNSLVMLVAGVAVLTLVGAGGGWVVGGMIAPKDPLADQKKAEAEAAAKEGEKGKGGEKGLPHISTEANGVVLLEPITTNLAYPSDNWVRLEVALAFNGPPEAATAESVHQDILAYLRTVSLQQIEGPRGFQYLRDDLQERASLRSQGKVAKILLRSFVIE